MRGQRRALARALSEHTVHTAQSKGRDTLDNGALLNAAEDAGFELLLTTDRLQAWRSSTADEPDGSRAAAADSTAEAPA